MSKQFYENCLNMFFIQNMFRSILRKLFKHCFFYQKIFENNFMKIVQTLFLSKRSLKQFYEHCLNIVFTKDL